MYIINTSVVVAVVVFYMRPQEKKAISLFEKHHGMLRTSMALGLGVYPETLYRLRDEGKIAEVSRGLYRLTKLPPLASPDLAIVALRVPDAVLCLVSALSFHELTTQLPHEIQLALPKGTSTPKIDHPPIRVFRFTGKALTEGIETHIVDRIGLKVYGPEKSVADCFKMRNKIGQDVALEALKLYLERKDARRDKLWHYAGVCRVQKVMLPYLEALQ